MRKQLTLLDMIRARGHLQATGKLFQDPLPMTTQPLQNSDHCDTSSNLCPNNGLQFDLPNASQDE